jgi:methylase of polypeptide subunit release factors
MASLLSLTNIRNIWLDLYGGYCKLLHPLYQRVRVDSLDLSVDSSEIMAPLSFSQDLLFGDIKGKDILDVGTGCGIIALAAKKRGANYVLGVDINPEAVANAHKNRRANLPQANGIEFVVGDIFGDIRKQFDIIVSNPPYFPQTPKRTRDYKYCGEDVFKRIVVEGKSHLKRKGEIRVLYPASCAKLASRLAKEFGYTLVSIAHSPGRDNRLLRFLIGQALRPRLRIFVFRPEEM